MIGSLLDIRLIGFYLKDEFDTFLGRLLCQFIVTHDESQVCLLHIELRDDGVVIHTKHSFQLFTHLHNLLVIDKGVSISAHLQLELCGEE